MTPKNSADTEHNDVQHVEERPFFFVNPASGTRLFGILYLPAEPAGIGIVFLHPVGPERIIGDTIPVNIARSLAARGVACLRFDYAGTGDSEGEFRDLSGTVLFSDIDAAVEVLRSVKGIGRIGMCGHRFGGMLASLYAERSPDVIEYLVLCAPVIDFSDFVYRSLMASISCQPVMFGRVIADRDMLIQNLEEGVETCHEGINLCNLDGFPLPRALWKSFAGRNLLHDEITYRRQCLVIDLNIPGKKKDSSVSELAARYGDGTGFMEFPVKYLPWVHNTSCLVTSIAGLNEHITEWVAAGI